MDKVFTREQFSDAVEKALDEFTDITLDGDGINIEDAAKAFFLGLQNVVFSGLIEKHLFGEEPIKEDTTI
jgi:hypothetical protein